MLIIGAKGFAKEVLEVLVQSKYNKNIFFYDDVNFYEKGFKLFSKFPVITSIEEAKSHFEFVDKSFTVGIGNPVLRHTIAEKFKIIGGEFSSVISPFAHIGHFENFIGTGANIMTGTVITNSVTIGMGSLINLNCTIGHDCVIGNFLEMSPGAHISGNCTIGNFVNLGTNATILPKIRVGDNVIIGAGCVVTKDVPSNSLVVGLPGKVIKELEPIVY
jgi:sugar O-acyltransferase (sialic acid O-acetyltransferase NeuD family)